MGSRWCHLCGTRQVFAEMSEITGELPHQFLLRVSQGEPIGEYTPTFEERMRAAISVAPYYAPKFSPVDQTLESKVENNYVSSEPLTEEEWLELYGNKDEKKEH